jgi:cytochrome oxidase Cu insertion factor (SCO1/SenC/PrrC family)
MPASDQAAAVSEAAAPVGDGDATADTTAAAETDQAMTDESGTSLEDQTMPGQEESMPGEGSADSGEAMADDVARPAWQQIVLSDARTGEPFTLASFSGKTIFVEPMATWCTNCRQQLGNVRQARSQLSEDETIFIGLSLETNLTDEMLAQYANDQGFDWLFAVMTPEMLQELANAFGRSITSAPSTPHFIISPDGSFTGLITGIDSPEQIVQLVQAARG